ncbi:MAG TPA: 3-isopropylmalate dehydrogenase [Thermoanaerobaculia bacterium]|nr:3-isopropylmalate dehydrogenase [Thermoanaerobaculia bacterium]
MKANLVLLPGDGVGPEVTAAARAILERVARNGGHQIQVTEAPIGGCAIDATGTPLPRETLARCRDADAILLGAVGGPQWSNPSAPVRPEQGLLELRSELGLFANLRPVPVFPALAPLAPLRPELLEGVDLLIVRELTGGLYFGPRQEQGEGHVAYDTMVYTTPEVERVAHVAFQAARRRSRRLASIDKANVLASMRLWRRTVIRVAEQYPDVEVEHMLVDAMAMHLMRQPARFDVILAGNLFGDILSDEAAVLAGSLGMLPSASLGASSQGLFEPVHGSAPDIAGRGVANPIGAVLSLALLLRHSLGLEAEASAIEKAVAAALETGLRTADLSGDAPAGTEEMTRAILGGL